MAHPLLDVHHMRAGGDRLGAEGVAEVVEAQCPDAGGRLKLAVAAVEGRAVHRLTLDSCEHAVVGLRVALERLQARQQVEHLLGGREGEFLGVVRRDDLEAELGASTST